MTRAARLGTGKKVEGGRGRGRTGGGWVGIAGYQRDVHVLVGVNWFV